MEWLANILILWGWWVSANLGWLANILILWGWWAIAAKKRYALLFGIVGGVMWGVIAVEAQMWDLLFIETAICILQLRAWVKWRPENV